MLNRRNIQSTLLIVLLGVFFLFSLAPAHAQFGSGSNPPNSSSYTLIIDNVAENNYQILSNVVTTGPSLGSTAVEGDWTSVVAGASAYKESYLVVDDGSVEGVVTSVIAGASAYKESYLVVNDGSIEDVVTYRPIIPRASIATVSVRYHSGWDRSKSVIVNVNHPGGQTRFILDQTKPTGNQFIELGSFYFDSGAGSSVEISGNGHYGVTVADAIKFEEIDDLSGTNVSPFLTLEPSHLLEPYSIIAGEGLDLDLGYGGFSLQSNYSVYVDGELHASVSPNLLSTTISGLTFGTHQVFVSVSAPYEISSPVVTVYVEAGDFGSSTDEDEDGLNDYWEYYFAGDLSLTTNGDPDGDGLSNLTEYQYRTNPFSKDSDGDGVDDDVEIVNGTVPTVSPRGDGDKLGDDWEMLHFGDLERSDYGDEDLDLLSNYEEMLLGSDPNVPYAWKNPVFSVSQSVQTSDFVTEITNPNILGTLYYTRYNREPLADSPDEGADSKLLVSIIGEKRHPIKVAVFYKGVRVSDVVNKVYKRVFSSTPSSITFFGSGNDSLGGLKISHNRGDFLNNRESAINVVLPKYVEIGYGWIEVDQSTSIFHPDYTRAPSTIYIGTTTGERWLGGKGTRGSIGSYMDSLWHSVDDDLFDNAITDYGLGWIRYSVFGGASYRFSHVCDPDLTSRIAYSGDYTWASSPRYGGGVSTYQRTIVSYDDGIFNVAGTDVTQYPTTGFINNLSFSTNYVSLHADDDSDGEPNHLEPHYYLGHDVWGDYFNYNSTTRILSIIKNRYTDQDGDGVLGSDELDIYHTDPDRYDTDGDRLPDSFEIQYAGGSAGLDPSVANSNGTVSGSAAMSHDGLSLLQEYFFGLDPNNPSIDEDGDGISNIQEIKLYGRQILGSADLLAFGANPIYAQTEDLDTDDNGDGIDDSVGVLLGIGINDNNSDNDSLTNAEELALGTDPLVADTDGDGVDDDLDDFPLDPAYSNIGSNNSGDTTPPLIFLDKPPGSILL